MKELISVVVMTYNRSAYLSNTLHSILNQTYKNIEVVIIDDGSTDNTEEIVSSIHDTRIRYIRNNNNSKNIALLKNQGINTSVGNYIAFCDDDDLWYPEKLETQIPFLKEYDLVCCNANIINSEGDIIEHSFYKLATTNFKISPKILFSENVILVSSILFKKEILKKEKFDDRNIKVFYEDWELWLRIIDKHKFFFLNINLVSIRRHSSITFKSIESRNSGLIDTMNFIRTQNQLTNYIYNKYANIAVAGANFALFKNLYQGKKFIKSILYILSFLLRLLHPFTFYYYFNRFFLKRNILY